MEIVQAPNSVLSAKAQQVEKVDKSILELIEKMKETLVNQHDPEGIGLAAPQVGKSLQIFIVKDHPDNPFYIFINPKLTLLEPKKPESPKKSKEREKLEGCLSLKDIWGTVKRAPKVKITFQDETGKTQTKTYGGFFATILQHEYDHLQGILFPRRVLEQQGRLYKSVKDEEGKDVFEPLELV